MIAMSGVCMRMWHFEYGKIVDFKGSYEEYSSAQ